MAIQTALMKGKLADAYGVNAAFGAAYTTVPGASAGTEPAGGSPAYARKALTWPGGGANPASASCTFDIPSGTTIQGVGEHTLATAGSYLDGAAVTSQTFASQGTLATTFNYTQT